MRSRDYAKEINDYTERHNLMDKDAAFFQQLVREALRDERERSAKIADERAAFNRRLARGRINDTVDSRVADLKLTRADEAEVIAKEIREGVEP